MKKFISIIVLILVIIGLVIGLGYSWNLIINKDKQISALNQENTDLKNTITNLNNTIKYFVNGLSKGWNKIYGKFKASEMTSLDNNIHSF